MRDDTCQVNPPAKCISRSATNLYPAGEGEPTWNVPQRRARPAPWSTKRFLSSKQRKATPMTDATMTTVFTEQHATNIGKIVLALREHVPADGRFALPGTPWAIPLLKGDNLRDTVRAVGEDLVGRVEADGHIVVALADLSDQEAADIVSSMLPWKEPAIRVLEAAESLPRRYQAALQAQREKEERPQCAAPGPGSTAPLDDDGIPF
jgi:hypothetical protein